MASSAKERCTTKKRLDVSRFIADWVVRVSKHSKQRGRSGSTDTNDHIDTVHHCVSNFLAVDIYPDDYTDIFANTDSQPDTNA
jgi:hypothetical protein